MTFYFGWKTVFLTALTIMSVCLLPAKADIRTVNNCSYPLTVFYRCQGGADNEVTLGPGASAQLGLSSPWTGVIWASQHANTNNWQCTQVEFIIAPANAPTWDFYDISLVNAYNEPVQIQPRGVTGCPPPTCPRLNVNSVCQLGNEFAGPDNACINTDGPGTVDTPSIDLFRQGCPQAKVRSNDILHVDKCNTPSHQYDVIWCPGANGGSTSRSASQYRPLGAAYYR